MKIFSIVGKCLFFASIGIPLNGGVVFDSNALKYALPGRHTSQLDQLEFTLLFYQYDYIQNVSFNPIQSVFIGLSVKQIKSLQLP